MEGLLKKEIVCSRTANRVIGVTLFVFLTTLGAFVRIPLPFSPVPLTLQTFFVLLSGAFLGSYGALSQVIYCALGIAGFSIFTNPGNGLLYLYGPTGGYILGFIFASLIAGKFLKADNYNFIKGLAIFSLADVALLLSGTAWLKIILGVSVYQAFLLGFIPFVAGDLLKIISAVSLYSVCRNRIREIF